MGKGPTQARGRMLSSRENVLSNRVPKPSASAANNLSGQTRLPRQSATPSTASQPRSGMEQASGSNLTMLVPPKP